MKPRNFADSAVMLFLMMILINVYSFFVEKLASCSKGSATGNSNSFRNSASLRSQKNETDAVLAEARVLKPCRPPSPTEGEEAIITAQRREAIKPEAQPSETQGSDSRPNSWPSETAGQPTVGTHWIPIGAAAGRHSERRDQKTAWHPISHAHLSTAIP